MSKEKSPPKKEGFRNIEAVIGQNIYFLQLMFGYAGVQLLIVCHSKSHLHDLLRRTKIAAQQCRYFSQKTKREERKIYCSV